MNASNGSVENRSLPKNATTTQVTLVTGETVTIVETENKTRYRVASDKRMHRVAVNGSTYVFPVGVDFSKFDRHLFNVDFLVQQNLTDTETDSIPIIVSEDDDQDYVAAGEGSETGSTLESTSGIEKTTTLESIDAEAGRVAKTDAKNAYANLESDDSIANVTLDIKYRVDLAATDEAVSASQSRQTYNVSGNDVTVAVVDTGIDESHPAIDNVVDQKDFTGDGDTKDEVGHGTHVAGIVASDNETHTGMAPNANLMDVRVLGDDGWGYTSWIVDGIEYADNQNADVISMSIGGPVHKERSNDRYTEAINNAFQNGTLVVVSAGNSGPGYQTISTPGVQSNAITVGASDASDGDIASFSSRGPTRYGYYLKPDVAAPGVGVNSAASDDAGYDERFVQYSGTSMAAPAVSGIAALVLEKYPSWSPERVKSVLTTTADPLGQQDVYTQGAGEVNATDAVGTQVVISPGTADFGMFANNTTATRTISVTNLGNSSVTLDGSVTATNIVQNETVTPTLNQSTITVAAGETKQLNLTIDTSVPHGVYSGRISFDNGTYTSIFGFVRAHEVTVEKQTIDGTSPSEDSVWLFSEDLGEFKTLGQEGLDQFNDSTITYHVVGSGEYNVLSSGINENNGQPIIFSKETTVDGDEHVVLNESNTTKYQLNASEAESKHGALSTRSMQVTYGQETDYVGYLGSISGLSADTSTVRFGVNEEFHAAVEHLLVPESAVGGEDNFSAEALYHLVHRLKETSDTTFHVDQSELTEKNVTYYRSERGESYDVRLSASSYFPYDWHFDHVTTDGIGDRRHQTIYLNDNVRNHGVGATSEETTTPSWNLSTLYTLNSESRDMIYETVNEHPYVGSVNWRFDDGELDYFYSVPQLGQGPHVFEDDQSDTATLTIGGTTVVETNSTEGYFYDSKSRNVNTGETVELTVTGRNGATPLSTRSVSTYRTTYQESGDNEPPEIYRVDTVGVTTNNTDGNRVKIQIVTVGDTANLSALMATDADTVPFESGSEWKSMSVEKVSDGTYIDAYEATLDVNEQFGQFAGRLDLAVKATDDDSNVAETTTFDAIRVDAVRPTITVTASGSSEQPSTVSETVYTNRTLTANVTTNGTPDGVRFAGGGLSADFTNFESYFPANRTTGQNWTISGNLSDVPDDGNYTLEVGAVDRFWNTNITETNVTVVLDRDAPELGAKIERINDTHGRVVVTANEPLQSVPTAKVELPNSTTTDVTVTENGSVWDGTFTLTDSGSTYNASVSGTDRAGNTVTATSNAEIQTVSTENKTVTVVLEKSGLFVEFRTNQTNVSSTVTVTGSQSAFAPLSGNLAGLNFLNGELGANLTDNLDGATIGIPVNESNLPPGIDKKQVNISYYDAENGNWELLNTTVENRTIDNETDTYWVTNVKHFSTYGAVADDQQAPSVDAKAPDGNTFTYGTSQVNVSFDYSDDISGVNTSAVELDFDGQRVTDANTTNVTSEYVTYNATELEAGDHTATVTVVDEAGNEQEYTATFTVESDTVAPSVVSADPANGTTFSSGTESVSLTVDFTDDVSGVETTATKLRFDGIDVTDSATVGSDSISYTDDSLSNGSSHTFEVYLEDAEGNSKWHTFEFDIKSKDTDDDSGGGGGGGGGGSSSVPPPAVQVEVLELTDTYAKAKMTNARAGAPGDVSFDSGLTGGDATFRGVEVVPESKGAEARFFVEAESSQSAPSGVAALDATSETLGYLNVVPTYISDSDIDTVSITFGVDAEITDAPENVVLYYYSDGTWSEVETSVLGKQGGSYRLEASGDATGTYAVGLSTPSFAVREATVDTSSVATGESVTVSATVENEGTGEGTYTAELVVDGETVASEQVTLTAGETTTIEFTQTFDTGGEYDVSVGPADAGVLVVSSEKSTTTTTTNTPDGKSTTQQTSGDGGNSGGIPGFGVSVTVVAFLVTALLARRRES